MSESTPQTPPDAPVPMQERIARLLSDIFQPVLVGSYVLLIVAFATIPTRASALAWGVGLSLLTAGVPSLDILRRMRRSTVTDFHIFAREQRLRPLLVALACAAGGFALSYWLGTPLQLQASLLAALVTGSVLTAVTGRWKISFHAATAASAVVLLVWVLGWGALALAPVIPAIAWSRVRLGRHTLAQVAAGAAAGVALTLLVLVLYGPD